MTMLHDLVSFGLVVAAVAVGWAVARLAQRIVRPYGPGVGWADDAVALAVADTVWLTCRACGGLETPHRRSPDGDTVCLWCPTAETGADRA